MEELITSILGQGHDQVDVVGLSWLALHARCERAGHHVVDPQVIEDPDDADQ